MFAFAPGLAFSVLPAGEGLERFVFSHLFLAVNASVMVSVAFMFSCFNMKPAAATILALSFLFVSVVMESIPFFDRYENWFITHHFKCWLLVFRNPIPWPLIFQSEIVLFAVSATAFVIGSMAFQVRDIKS
jgi:ABC-2 type transport system permease protein